MIERAARVVAHAPVRVHRQQRAERRGRARGERDGEHRPAVRVAVVGEHADVERRVLVGRRGVVADHRRVVAAHDAHGDRGRRAPARAVGQCVEEPVLQRLALGQLLEPRDAARVVEHAAVAVSREPRAKVARRVHQ